MKHFTLKVAAVLFCASFASVSYAGTPYTEVVLSKDAPVVIEGENFDKDGEGVSYQWNLNSNPGGGEYRPETIVDGVHHAGINDSENASNGHICGWTDGVWTIYTVTVKDAGNYKFTLHAGAGGDGLSKWSLTNVQDEVTVTGTLNKEDYIDWDNGNLRSSVVLSFSKAGTYEIKFSTGGGFNFDCWDVEYTTEDVTVSGNCIPGNIDSSDFIKEEGEYHLGQVHLNQTIGGYLPESQLFSSDHLGWLNDPGWDTSVNPDLDCSEPDFFKYKTYIRRAGTYYVFFQSAGPDDRVGEINLYYYAKPMIENLQFCCSTGWDDYEWNIGGTVNDVAEKDVEPLTITVTDEMVSKDMSDLKTIKLEVVHGFNLMNIAFVDVNSYDINSFDAEEFAGVKNVTVKNADNVYYNLQGMKVANPTKGLYIINGKKVILK